MHSTKRAKKSTTMYAVIIPMTRNSMPNVMTSINDLLRVCVVPIFWAAKPFDAKTDRYPKGHTYSPGDFIIPAIMDKHDGWFFVEHELTEQEVVVDRCTDPINLTVYAITREIKVAIYMGRGTQALSYWHVHALEKGGFFRMGLLDDGDIQKGKLIAEEYDVYIHPGNSHRSSFTFLGRDGCEKINEFVTKGGGYIGCCAGAYLAALGYDELTKQVELVESTFSFIEEKEYDGPRPRYPGWGLTAISIEKPEHPIMFGFGPGPVRMLYLNGPVFMPEEKLLTLATFLGPIPTSERPWVLQTRPQILDFASIDEVKDFLGGKGAIVTGVFASGKIVLFSPHPEAPEFPEQHQMIYNAILYEACDDPIEISMSEGVSPTELFLPPTSLGSTKDMPPNLSEVVADILKSISDVNRIGENILRVVSQFKDGDRGISVKLSQLIEDRVTITVAHEIVYRAVQLEGIVNTLTKRYHKVESTRVKREIEAYLYALRSGLSGMPQRLERSLKIVNTLLDDVMKTRDFMEEKTKPVDLITSIEEKVEELYFYTNDKIIRDAIKLAHKGERIIKRFRFHIVTTEN